MKTAEMLTPKQYAAKHGVPYTTVMRWLQNDLIKGARKEPLSHPMQGYFYQIPEDAPKPELKPGPKPGAKKKAPKSRPSKKSSGEK